MARLVQRDEEDNNCSRIKMSKSVNNRPEEEGGSATSIINSERIFGMTTTDVMTLEFGSLHEAEQFYKSYGRAHGFGIRLDVLIKDKHGQPTTRRMVCAAQGSREVKHIEKPNRQREHKPITRFKCKAGMRVTFLRQTGKWHVFRFNDDHSHELLGPKDAPFHRCHRTITEADKVQVGSMCNHGFSGASIYGLIVGQSGGYEKTGFTKKDLYNHLTHERLLRIGNGDAMAALHYLKGKSDSDPNFYLKYATDSDDRLQHLFWVDGQSKLDLKCFGDVIAFDTTYKKNKYNMPFIIFSGVNHHRKTTIFACALVTDETDDTYKWVLGSLLEVMDGKQPLSVVTDSDKSMQKAIKSIFPNSCHRLCAWHLERNATSNICNPQFTKAFKECMFVDTTVVDFENRWNTMVKKYGVLDNPWVQKMYRKRTMWASAYLRGKRFIGLRTTSQCESMNAWLKRYVKHSHNLLDFLQHFHRGLSYMRYNDMVVDHASRHGQPVLTTALESLERIGAEVYTREAFWLFRRELKLSGACVSGGIMQTMTTMTYKVRRYLNPEIVWNVHIDGYDTVRIMCECGKLPSFGIPCQHIIFVLVQEDIDYLPNCLIVDRWRKNAKTLFEEVFDSINYAEYDVAAMRFGSLMSTCRLLCNVAAVDAQTFAEARQKLQSITMDFEARKGQSSAAHNKHTGHRILDPIKSRTKGRPVAKVTCGVKRKKRCTLCRHEGHTKATCKKQRVHAGDDDIRTFHESCMVASQTDSTINPNAEHATDLINATMVDILGDSASKDFAMLGENIEEPTDEDTGIWTIDGTIAEHTGHVDSMDDYNNRI